MVKKKLKKKEIKPVDLLAKKRVQLFRDVVLFVFDFCLSKFDCNVWICFPIDVSWMQISGLTQKKKQAVSNLLIKNVQPCSREHALEYSIDISP